jgi:hypothetical protein
MNKETNFFGASCERLKLNQSEVDQGRPDGAKKEPIRSGELGK